MKTSLKLFFLSVFLTCTLSGFSQTTITIHSRPAPVIDGIYSVQEWADADTASIDLLDGRSLLVRYKKDASALYFLFSGPIASYSNYYAMFPEVSIDGAFNKSELWQCDDQWFHVSYTDCSSIGAPDIYTNCVVTQPDWIGIPNFSMSLNPDTIEMKIPFAKLGINEAYADTIGICFMGNTTQGSWRMWPKTADKFKPSTWAKAILEHSVSVHNTEIKAFEPEIFIDNINHNIRIICKDENLSKNSYFLFNVRGKEIIRGMFNTEIYSLDSKDLRSGIYILSIISNGHFYNKKIIIQQL